MTIPVAPTKMSGSDPKKIGGVWSFIHRFNALVDWIISLSPAGSTQYDTKWVTIQSLTASRPQIDARRVGNRVYIYADGPQAMASEATTTILADGGIPDQFRPTKANFRATVSIGGRPAIGVSSTLGALTVVNQTGAARANINASLWEYPVD